jgi:hypothetical protein
MNVIERIVSHGFVATDADVQQLAAQVVAGKTADSTYLKVLIVAVQSAKAKRGQSQLGHFELIAERMYQLVLEGVGGAEVPKEEVNRRATFARTSASALRKWIKGGGDIKTLDPITTTKRSLAPVRPKLPGDRLTRAIRAHSDALLASVQKMEAKDPNKAERVLNELIESLQAELLQLSEEESESPARVVRVPHMERVLHSKAA